ncbi:hypothetical protein WAI453_002173 [Rhynchosporium graminicola]
MRSARFRDNSSASEQTRSGRPGLLFYDELHSWQQDNEFILSGYRPATGSFQKSFASLIGIHNETVNIYSHLLGSLLFLRLPFVVTCLSTQLFFFGVAICFFLSATFHIFGNHSAHVHQQGNQLEYLGIVILMWDSTIPSVYNGFYCDPGLQKLYWLVVTIIASECVYATLHPKFRHPDLRPWRAAMYAGLGLSAIIFIIPWSDNPRVEYSEPQNEPQMDGFDGIPQYYWCGSICFESTRELVSLEARYLWE